MKIQSSSQTLGLTAAFKEMLWREFDTATDSQEVRFFAVDKSLEVDPSAEPLDYKKVITLTAVRSMHGA